MKSPTIQDRWTVVVGSASRDGRCPYTLTYNGKEYGKETGTDGKRTLEAQAAFFNERGTKPSAATCRADGLTQREARRQSLEQMDDMFVGIKFTPKPKP